MESAATSEPIAAPRAGVSGWTWLILAALTALGAALRLYGLDRQSLWNDELGSAAQFTLPTLGQVWAFGIPPTHLPGYWVLMHFWSGGFSDSEAWLRLPSALLGIATIPAMFALGRRWYGPCEGLLAAAITTVAWAPVFFSQEARPYALLLLAVVCSTAWLTDVVRALRAGASPPRGALGGYVVAASVTAYAHFLGLLLLCWQAAAAGLLLWRRRGALPALAAMYGAVLLLFGPALYRFLGVPPQGLTWLAAPDPTAFWKLLVFYCNQSQGLAWAVVGLWALALARTLIRRAGVTPATWLLIVWLAGMLGFVYAWSHILAPAFLERALIVVAPAIYLLIARALTQLPLRRAGVWASATAVIGLLLVHLVWVKGYYSVVVKEQFREAAAYLVAHDAPERPALVLACTWNRHYFDYYLGRLGSPRRVDRLAETAADAAAVQALVAERQPVDVWLLAGHKQPAPALLAALAEHMTLVGEQHLKGTAVWHFRNG